MTGFGSSRGRAGEVELFVEARSVNHRYLEVNCRFPHRFASWEGEVTKLVRQLFQRGKFDLFVREGAKENQEVALARESYRILAQIRKTLRLKQEISIGDLLDFREIYYSRYARDHLDKLKGPFLVLMRGSLKKLDQMRHREGGHLGKWFRSRLTHLHRLLNSIEREMKLTVAHHKQKAEQKMKALGVEGQERFVQEAGILSDKGDVTEEIVRLRSHMKEFLRVVQSAGTIGRKLDFLAQEMGREINTIGSKSQGVRLTHQVVDFKSELEKIREQVQNIE